MNTAVANSADIRNSSEGLFASVASFFKLLGAAHRAKVAIESRRQPARADLHLLGIDPAAMPDVRNVRF